MRFSPCRKTRRWPYFQASDFKLVPLWRVIAGPRAMYECKEKEMRISAPTACVCIYTHDLPEKRRTERGRAWLLSKFTRAPVLFHPRHARLPKSSPPSYRRSDSYMYVCICVSPREFILFRKSAPSLACVCVCVCVSVFPPDTLSFRRGEGAKTSLRPVKGIMCVWLGCKGGEREREDRRDGEKRCEKKRVMWQRHGLS